MKTILCLSAIVCVGCIDNAGGRDRQSPLPDSAVPITDTDGPLVVNDGGMATDSRPLDGASVLGMDAARVTEDGGPPLTVDAAPSEPDGNGLPEECNGEDEDDDGRIDEGVANACGGCGGIPPGGCEAWSVNLVQDGDALLNPGRIVYLAARILGSSSFSTTNAECDHIRTAMTSDPDRTLGTIEITTPEAALSLVPGIHPATDQVVYDTDPSSPPLQVHQSGDEVRVDASGGQATGPFETSITAPETLTEVDADALEPWVAAAQGRTTAEPLTLSWGAGSGDIRLYVGGSKQVFGLTAFYRGIEHYLLNLTLEDSGEVSVPGDVFGDGSPNSAVWAYLARTRTHRIPLNQHAVGLEIGQRVELRANGGIEEAAMPPFQITAPNPNDHAVEAGAVLPVQWSRLPPGPGPLTVQLVFRNSDLGEQHVVSCTVEDPAAGAMEIPANIMAAWPEGNDFRQISLRWTLLDQPLNDVGQGGLSRASTMLLRLDR